MHSTSILFLTLFCALCVNGAVKSAGTTNGTGHILGGNTAYRGSFKWATYIRLGGPTGTQICGGSLISNIWVLTAAHCLQPYSSFEVTLGAADFTIAEPGRVVQTITATTANKIVHIGYVPSTKVNDIAVLKLNSAVTFTVNIDIIRLPKKSQVGLTFVDKYVTMVGWGSTAYFNGPSSSTLRSLTSHKVITNTDCAVTYGTLQPSQMCSNGPDGQNVCGGDSGGPVSWVDSTDYKHVLIGIMSFGYNTANQHCNSLKPAGHTRVTSFLTWINDKTGIVIQP